MTSRVLPTTRHVKELITHAEEHLSHESNSDLKFSLIHADNSIEIMLKEHLRYKKEKSWGEIDRKGFYKLLSDCEDVTLIKDSKGYFLAYHDMRNSVYHTGTLVPPKGDVMAAIGLAKTLFNELHPDQQFKEAKIELPSQQSVNNLMQIIGTPNHLRGITLVSEVSHYLKNNGYTVELEYSIAGRIRADIVAEKQNTLIICELKSMKRPVGTSAFHQLKAMYNHLVELNPNKDVEGWLITNGTFTDHVKILSKEYSFRLIDGKELKKLIGTREGYYSEEFGKALDYLINESKILSQDKDEIAKHIGILNEESVKNPPTKWRIETSWKYIERNAPYIITSILSKVYEEIISRVK